MIHLAYDGSLHGLWVARYAIRMAAHHPSRHLRVLHVREHAGADPLGEHIGAIERECSAAAVELELEVLPQAHPVVGALVEALGGDDVLVCGTRAQARNLALLSGTVSEALLRTAPCPVLAVRVVHPGVLGVPRALLLPVRGHPRRLAGVLPVLGLLAPDLERLDVLFIEPISRRRFRTLAAPVAERLLAEGRRYVAGVEEELAAALPSQVHIDGLALLSDDAPKEIVIAANRLRSRLVVLGASERGWRERIAYGSPVEQVLRNAPCDVAVCGGRT